MERRVRLEGQVFGRLTVVRFAGATARSNGLWSCQCSCGKTTVVLGNDLKRGHTTSCGCWRKENNRRIPVTHGLSHRPEFRVWCSMRSRCTNPKNADYKYYGALGVRVCEEWASSFETFYKDMGPRPSRSHSIDRKDPKGNYEPSNCRWATRKQQAMNKRNTWKHGGKTQAQWAKELGITQSAVSKRFTAHGTVFTTKQV